MVPERTKDPGCLKACLRRSPGSLSLILAVAIDRNKGNGGCCTEMALLLRALDMTALEAL